ncbi:hypothetical protein LQE92_01285 [Lacrimispora sp. NSJ-141]|uniref:Uncharacterized protein n=1 Tax=Lientehia hominis TaxID=2897778 RepID=A0AAP2W7P1_9FIRM|nr:hypothetical protein [Lientehia hominis]MCD2491260.1 hypothetical protein [Lientehia hominis]
MRKGILGKVLAISAIAGGAAILIAKLVKNSAIKDSENRDFEEDDFCCCDDCGEDTLSRNYVPLSHSSKEEDSEEAEESDSREEKED